MTENNQLSKEELLQLTRAYRIISKCNPALIKEYNEIELMRYICTALVDDGGYAAAWVGICDNGEKKNIQPRAQKGLYPELTDTSLQEGPPVRAICEKSRIVCKDIQTDPLWIPWLQHNKNLQCKASLALPLQNTSTTFFGVLVIYAQQEDAFSATEQELLQELAENLSFGIEIARINNERDRYENELTNRIKELQGLFQLNILVDNNLTISTILEQFTREILPGSMKYPELIACKTEFDTFVFKHIPQNEEENKYFTCESIFSVPIFVEKEQRGQIIIAYPDTQAVNLEQVEYSVLQAFADKLGKFITRIEAQNNLIESKKRMQNILDSLPDIIFEIDPNMRITWANNKAVDEQKGVLGQYCYTVYHNRKKPCPNCPSVKALQTGEIKRGSIYFSEGSEEGAEQYLENIGVPIFDQEGTILGVMEIARDITAYHQTKEKLERYNKELRSLSHHLQLVREEERKNISREIHDELGQAITAIKMDAYWINKNIPEVEKQLRQKTEDMLILVDETVKNVQRLINDLRLGFPEDLDFRSSLEWLIEDFTERSELQTSFTIDSFPNSIHPQSSITAFRLLQESLTNISRHSKSNNVEIFIQNKNNTINISISDDGVGISEKELYSASSYGIIGMRERCLSLGGHLEIQSIPKEGTHISARIPIVPHVQ